MRKRGAGVEGRRVNIHYSDVSIEERDRRVKECLGALVDVLFEDPKFKENLRQVLRGGTSDECETG